MYLIIAGIVFLLAPLTTINLVVNGVWYSGQCVVVCIKMLT